MILIKNWNFFLCLLLNKIGLEIMFPDHPVREQAYLDWKIKILPSRPMEIFSMGLTHDSGQQLEFFFCVLLNKKPREIMFPDHLVRKQAYLDWKIRILPNRPMEIFSKGLTHHSGQKLEFFPLLPFKQNRPWNNICWPSG